MKKKPDEKIEKESEKCPRCGGVLYRHFDLVDGDYLDDGAQCEDCGEWTG